MVAFILRRLLHLIPTLIGVSILVFIIMRFVPGDPATMVGGIDASNEDIALIRKKYGLDRPLPMQYFIYMKNIFMGDFGVSIRSGQTVLSEWSHRFPETMKLALLSTAIATTVGIIFGILASTRPNTILDSVIMGFAILGVSIPVFWLGLMLILVFAVDLSWFPTSGSAGIRSLVLPSLTLAASTMAIVARQMRSDMLGVLSSEYVRTARAKGLQQFSVVGGHALRNALVPTVTVIGLQFGNLLAGAVITETVFAWPGIGRLLIDAIKFRDYPVVQSTILLLATLFVLVNLLVDVCYFVLDPRLRKY